MVCISFTKFSQWAQSQSSKAGSLILKIYSHALHQSVDAANRKCVCVYVERGEKDRDREGGVNETKREERG